MQQNGCLIKAGKEPVTLLSYILTGISAPKTSIMEVKDE